MSDERLAEIEKRFLEDDTVTDCGGCWGYRTLPEVLAIAKRQRARIRELEAQVARDGAVVEAASHLGEYDDDGNAREWRVVQKDRWDTLERALAARDAGKEEK